MCACQTAAHEKWEQERKHREFLDMVASVEKAAGQKIEALCYKRPKAAPSQELAPFYAWKEQIACCFHEDFSQETFGQALGDRVRDRLWQLKPLYDYFNRFCV